MKAFAVLCLFVVGAAAQYSYSIAPAAAPAVPAYSAPATVALSPASVLPVAAAPAVPALGWKSVPVEPTHIRIGSENVSPAEAAAPVSYGLPAPAAAPVSYSLPAPAAAPVSYGLPAPAAAPLSYGLPAPAAAPASYGYDSSPMTRLEKPAPVVPILSYTQSLTGGLSDSHSFSTGDGVQKSENTQVVPGSGHLYEGEDGKMEKSDSSLVKSGSVSYTSPEGIPISLSYTAGEDGFKPTGSHLPVAPAVPAMPEELVAAYAKAASDYKTAAAANAAAPETPSSSYAPAPAAPAYSAPAYSAPAAPAFSAPAYSAPAAPAYSAPAAPAYSAPAAPAFSAPAAPAYSAPAMEAPAYAAPATVALSPASVLPVAAAPAVPSLGWKSVPVEPTHIRIGSENVSPAEAAPLPDVRVNVAPARSLY